MIFVEECSVAKSVTLFVRGSTKHIVDEIVRAIEDAIGVVAATVAVSYTHLDVYKRQVACPSGVVSDYHIF